MRMTTECNKMLIACDHFPFKAAMIFFFIYIAEFLQSRLLLTIRVITDCKRLYSKGPFTLCTVYMSEAVRDVSANLDQRLHFVTVSVP